MEEGRTVEGTSILKNDVQRILPGLEDYSNFLHYRARTTEGGLLYLLYPWNHVWADIYAMKMSGSDFFSLALSASTRKKDRSIRLGTQSEKELFEHIGRYDIKVVELGGDNPSEARNKALSCLEYLRNLVE